MPVALRCCLHACSFLMSVSDGISGAHLDLMDGRAGLPRVGAVVKGPSLSLPYVVTDAAGREVEPGQQLPAGPAAERLQPADVSELRS